MNWLKMALTEVWKKDGTKGVAIVVVLVLAAAVVAYWLGLDLTQWLT